ncbi:hypothetical protein MMC17_009024 [Xylographa soralifera]|nr:hypothetical protein [Xylographa soralifera]
MASYQPLPRSSTSSDRAPPSPSPKLKSLTLNSHFLFRLDAFICATISLSLLAVGRHQSRGYNVAPYKQSLITVYVALGLSLLSQLGPLAAACISQMLHVNTKWKRNTSNAPAARQRRSARLRALSNGLLGVALLTSVTAFTIIATTWRTSDTFLAGQAFGFLTGFVHLILAFLPAEQLRYRVLFAVTTAPAGELSLEPKSPAIYQDVEDVAALDV